MGNEDGAKVVGSCMGTRRRFCNGKTDDSRGLRSMLTRYINVSESLEMNETADNSEIMYNFIYF